MKSATKRKISIIFSFIAIFFLSPSAEAGLFGIFSSDETQKPAFISSAAIFMALLTMILVMFFRNRQEVKQLKKMEQSINRASRLNQSILESMPVGVAIFLGNPPKVIDCNDELTKMFDAPKQQITTRYFEDFSPEYLPDGKVALNEAISIMNRVMDGETVRVEWPHQTAKGVPVPCDLTLTRVRNEEDFIGLCFLYDLRDVKKIYQELREHGARLEAAIEETHEANRLKNISIRALESILNSLDALVYVTIPKTGELIFANTQMRKAFNLKDEDLVGVYCYKLIRGFDKMCAFCPCFHLDANPGDVVVWDEYLDGLDRHLRHSDSYIDWPNGEKVHLQHAVDITELITAKKKAEQASRYKSSFLATMSHEIRTPMNAILGITEIQLRNESLTPDMEEALQKIYESGDLLIGIINDILDLSKIEADKLELIIAKYDMPSLVNDTAQLHYLRYESKPIEFIINVDKNTPLNLLGDVLRIKQVLNNILSNAFKYTDEGVIEFSVAAEPRPDNEAGDYDTMLVFRVRDTGVGMTEEHVGKLFDEYTRFDLRSSQITTGTGLGMSIVKRLVDMMNGNILVESEPGKGSMITVRLPQKRIDSAVCGAETVASLRRLSFFHNSAASNKMRFSREYMPYGSVLVVDDVDSNLYVTKGMLMPYGLKIEMVSSGLEAIEKIKNGAQYDIVFMDHMMPKMDGMEATKIIRDMGYKNTIVALTANALLGQEENFLANGFDGFISKPIDSRKMDLLLNNFIKNQKPPEVVEAARRRRSEKKAKAAAEPVKTMMKTSEIKTIFVRDAKKAVSVIEKVYADLPDVDEAEIKDYIIAVHGIKSSLDLIGEKEISAAAFKLEKAGGERNFAVMSDETPALLNTLRSLIVEFTPKEEEDETVEVSDDDAAYLRGKMLEIKTACAAFDKKTAQTALADLRQKRWPCRINDFFDDIAGYLLHSAFKKASAVAENTAEMYKKNQDLKPKTN